jgi:hypothetical protein
MYETIFLSSESVPAKLEAAKNLASSDGMFPALQTIPLRGWSAVQALGCLQKTGN